MTPKHRAPTRARAFLARGRIRRWVLITVIAATLGVAATESVVVRGQVQAHRDAVAALREVVAQVEGLEVTGRRLAADGRAKRSLVPQVVAAAASVERELRAVEASAPGVRGEAGFRAAAARLRRSAEAMAAALRRGDRDAAEAIARREAAGALAPLRRSAGALAAEHAAAAAGLQDTSNLLLLATVLVGLVVASMLAWRLEVLRRREQAHVLERRADARLRAVLDQVGDVITVLDRDLRVSWQAESIRRLLGREPATVLGEPLPALAHPRDADATRAALATWAAEPGAHGPLTVRLRHADGSWPHVEVMGQNRLDDPLIGGLLLSLRDVTERVRLEDTIRHQAFHDALTGLANRALFEDRLGLALAARGQAPAVLFLDLDDFKTVNDSLGHAAGDALLRSVADRLRAVVREGDTAARFGGDEFALLLAGARQDEALRVARRLLDSLALPVAVHDRLIAVSGSVGVALAEADSTAETLLRAADVAMYAAKRRGKRQVARYEPAMHVEALDRLDLAEDLRSALGREQLEIHYQPVVELATGRTVAFEALLRWRHPLRGVLCARDFLAVAEDTGAIVEIGAWALRQACRDAATWPGAAVPVGVNVSGRQLVEPGFPQLVAATLRDHGLPPSRLGLEVTEGLVADGPDAARAALHALADSGIHVAVDDFGTGRSALGRLVEFPPAQLKVDHSLVARVDADPGTRRLVHGVLELGRSLGVSVVLEGIERPAQRDALLALGAVVGQGRLYASALPAGAAAARLASEAANASTASATAAREA